MERMRGVDGCYVRCKMQRRGRESRLSDSAVETGLAAIVVVDWGLRSDVLVGLSGGEEVEEGVHLR